MVTQKNMRKNKLAFGLTLLVTSLISGVVFAQQARQFPYSLPLTGDSKPDVITEYFGVTDIPVPDERYSDRGIALTYKVGDREQTFTGFALDEVEFTSEFGIIVEFKYAMIDGHTFNGRYGDGFSMFLYDSSKPFEIGGHGASLGYAYRNSNYAGQDVPGLNGGYLGVGFDVYGDFKARSQAYGEKKEGIDYNWHEVGSHVTIRGGQHKDDRYKGYPVLYTMNADVIWKVNTAKLEIDTGDYYFHDDNFLNQFEMRTGYDRNGNIKYNTVTVRIMPDYFDRGTELEIKIKEDRNEKILIRNLLYPNKFKTRDQNGEVYDFETKIPDNFKIGFAAGTGGAYQMHLIKDVKIRLPYQPDTDDIRAQFCRGNNNNEGRQTRFDPFEDAYFYAGTVARPDAGNTSYYIDYDSFRFEDEEGYSLNDNNPFRYEQSGVGTWEYDGSRTVTFTASEDNISEGEYSIYYSAKGVDRGDGPFGKEAYRSRPTKLTVVVQECKRLTNPLLPIRIKIKEGEED